MEGVYIVELRDERVVTLREKRKRRGRFKEGEKGRNQPP